MIQNMLNDDFSSPQWLQK